MPKLPKEPVKPIAGPTRKKLLASDSYANALSRVLLGKPGLETSDLYRMGRTVVEYFESHPEAKREFVQWYEAL